ncbi:MAG: hypothetical protein IT319_12250, partial [Anaerolineae bacterium]|nr:hypothetical protein [Anaerolineae bacterium]
PGWQSPTAEPAPLLVALDAHDVPVAQAAQWDRPRYAVPVPTDIAALRQTNRDVALAWRLAVREAMLAAFEQGYAAVDFVKQDDQYVYLLSRSEALP